MQRRVYMYFFYVSTQVLDLVYSLKIKYIRCHVHGI